MNLLRSLHRISQLLAVFVAQVKEYGATQQTDINRVAESMLLPLFREVYGYHQLEDLNHTEGPNFAGIDLGDRQARVAVQVTSTPTTAKVKHMLEQVVKRELYRQYDRVIVYVLTEKQRSYPAATLSEVTGGRFDFAPQRDILDYRDLFKEVKSLTPEKILGMERLLEEHLGQPGPPSGRLRRACLRTPHTTSSWFRKWSNTSTGSHGTRHGSPAITPATCGRACRTRPASTTFARRCGSSRIAPPSGAARR